MEVVARAQGNKLDCIDGIHPSGSESAALKQASAPVIYKLVRIDVDGRYVPATDDELLEVENMLELERDDIDSEPDVFETVSLDKDNSEASQYKGSSQIKNEDDEDVLDPSHTDSTYHESGHEDGSMKSGSADTGPNFSLLHGEINLDKLSIRELQEIFRATFGRKTSAIEKLWLKRRIAMGLINSSDVPMTSFVINDGKLLNKMDDVSTESDDMSANSDSHPNTSEDTADDVALGCKTDDLEHRARKRVRKPTKRYIDETTGKSSYPSKCNEQEKSSLSSEMETDQVRRCCPRQSFMTLSKFDSSDVTFTSKYFENSEAPNKPRCDARSTAKHLDIIPVPSEEPIVTRELTEVDDSGEFGSQDIAVAADSNINPDTNSEDNMEIVLTANGGMRRKHHRAWSLSEVMKLVDGVSRFGVGRWSEIKRLSFSSQPYRTPVDIKDKWRNLLKASSSNLTASNETNFRTRTAFAIPAPIFMKVRELAEMKVKDEK